jgi:DNA-binding XRE family transcriptional regulator
MISEVKRGRGRPAGTGAKKSDAIGRLRAAMGTEEKPLSQDALARLLGCTERTVRGAEREGRLFSSGLIMKKFENLANAHNVKIESD